MYCKQCGANSPDGCSYCINCGAKFENAVPHQNLTVFHFIVLFTVFHNPFLCVIDWMRKERECLKENTMVNISLEKIKKRLPFF